MKTVTRYEFSSIDGPQVFQMPAKAIPRVIGIQDEKLCLWAEIPKQDTPIARTFHVVATGGDVDDKWVYVGSCSVVYHTFIYHVWEE